jgi:putative membrane protein
MTINMVLIWGLIILGAIALLRCLARDDRSPTSRLTPEQVLAERFARGQIDDQEYQQRIDVLRGVPRPVAKP